jgi:uncharacterized membrane protein YozB (DUF420 family)
VSLNDLPALNALLNGFTACCLALALYFIRKGNQQAHRNCMLTAIGASVIFLASYITYHTTVKTITYFREPQWFRPIYLTLLLTHTILAVTIIPLVIVTLSRALRKTFDRHKKIARWTWPLWMYVSVTGVLIYLLLYKIFPQK